MAICRWEVASGSGDSKFGIWKVASGSGGSKFGIWKVASGRRWAGGLACFLWFLFLIVLSLFCFV